MNYELHLSIGELKHLETALTGYSEGLKDNRIKTAVAGLNDKIIMLMKYAKTDQQAQRLTRQAETRKQKYIDLVTRCPEKPPEPAKKQEPEPEKKPKPTKQPGKQPGKKKPGEPVKRKVKPEKQPEPEPVKEPEKPPEPPEIDFDELVKEMEIDPV